MSCPCDITIFPPPLVIPAGLDDLPRQLAGFPEFRRAMLGEIPTKPALDGWRARGTDDFGVMLLEMWAYVCDVVSFYDKVLADEAYLRTAKLRPSLRRLVALLGYRPRPAVGATARLALFTQGRRPVLVPAGTAFLSRAGEATPPRVYELDADATIHRALNEAPLAAPHATHLSGTIDHLLLEPRTSLVREGDHVVVDFGSDEVFVCRAAAVTRIADSDETPWVRVRLAPPITLTGERAIADTRIYRATRTAQLRHRVETSESAPFVDTSSRTDLALDGRYLELHAGDRVLVARGDDFRTAVVRSRTELQFVVSPAEDRLVAPEGADIPTIPVHIPEVKGWFSRIRVRPSLNAGPGRNWTNSDAPRLTVHFALVDAGRIGGAAALVLAPDDPLDLVRLRHIPTDPPDVERFLLRDEEDRGVELSARLDWETGELIPVDGTDWSPDLALPVTAYGNVVDVSRGETVAAEVLGSGDAALADQSFELKKKPLTYLPSPTADNESGVASTLRIRVDGVLWREVSTFYGQPTDAQVYIVRQKDDGTSVITFGDGVTAGARLPSGADNVVASYRFGAEGESPPAGGITQLARPVPGLRRAVNPVAAAGGADAEPAGKIRSLAPRSALLLGRAVSMLDMEAAAAATPGVIDAAAEWRWAGDRQRPVAMIWYIGEAGLELTLSRRLRAISDPSTPIDVEPATAVPAALAIDVETDPRRLPEDVVAAVRAALLDPERGIVSRERIGIGKPLFRSRIFAAVLAVPGALGVRTLQWNGTLFDPYGKSPGAGRYFDLRDGLAVSGSAGTSGPAGSAGGDG